MATKAQEQAYIIERLDELPTLPSVVYELSQIIADPMSSTKDVEKVMENDQSLTAKVLKLVNSAYYAIPGGVSNLSRAIAYIGFDTVHQLVLSASILKALEVKGPSAFDMNEFWKHSIGVGVAAETIATAIGSALPADMFTCGLVHDMGKIALYSIDQEMMLKTAQHAQEKQISFYEAEEELDHWSHTEIGHRLAEKWRLPSQIQAVIRYHHQENPIARGGISAEMNNSVDTVYLANLLIHALKFGKSGHQKILGAPKIILERLTIEPKDGLKDLVQQIKQNLDKASDFIRVISS